MKEEIIIQLKNLPLLLNKQEQDIFALRDKKEKKEFQLAEIEKSHRLTILAESESEAKKKELRNAELRENALKQVLLLDGDYQQLNKEVMTLKKEYEEATINFRNNERLFSSAKAIARLLSSE